jgi:hypothetical protein
MGVGHYYKKKFARHLGIFFGGGQHFQPPRLMPRINRGGSFLLTQLQKTASQNLFTEPVEK